MDDGRVVIAEILRPRGNRGEVVARSQTDVPGRIESLRNANARLANGSDLVVEIAAAWRHRGEWVLKFAGIDSIEAADRFRGADLWVRRGERGQLAEGDFFRSDLIGCSVLAQASGECVGVVRGFQSYGGPPLMEVEHEGREVLIPFVAEASKVDLEARTIRVDLPKGLLDL